MVQRRAFLKTTMAVGCTAALRQATAAGETEITKTAKVPLEDFFRDARYDKVSLSPDGRFLGALATVNKRMNLVMIDLDTSNVTVLTNFKESDVQEFYWINDRRLLFRLRDDIPDPNYLSQGDGLWAVDRDGSGSRELVAPTKRNRNDETINLVYRFLDYVATVEGTDELIVAANEVSADVIDLYRMNSHTGRKTLLTADRPPFVTRWVLDRMQRPRVAVTFDYDTGKEAVFYRAADAGPWQRIGEWETLENDGFEPIAFDFDGSLLVSARAGQDKAALYRFDQVKGVLGEKLAGHKEYDIGYGNGSFLEKSAASSLIFDSDRKMLVGLRIDAEKPHYVWLDEAWARWHASLQASLPDHVIVMKPVANGQKVAVYAYSDRDPGRWYLFEPAKGQLKELAARRPWIKAEQMARSKPVRYTARDGLSIAAYLTLPADGSGKGLPAVMLPHGGPFVRGQFWVWDRWAQFLASRGYAVLQPEYRGSRGYGYSLFRAGWKQQGRAMQFDVADGARWLIAEGIADPKRIAIMGHSAGGYATMMGLILEPGLYRCGANSSGPTDLIREERLRTGGRNVPKGWELFTEKAVGTVARDHDLLASYSPALRADGIKAPVLMGYGEVDPTVPRFHADEMATALRAAKVKCDLVMYPNQGHWWDEATEIDYFRRVEKFLAENLA